MEALALRGGGMKPIGSIGIAEPETQAGRPQQGGLPPHSTPLPPEPPPALSRMLDSDMRGSVMAELIVDKLKLLHYEQQFCSSRSPPWPRLHKFYFALPSLHRNEQFLYFSSLAAWLFGLLGCQFAPPSEINDPNMTCAKIMMELMNLGLAPPGWLPARLKQGYGDAVCSVLDTLCSLVLDAIKFEFPPIAHSCQEELLVETGDDESASELYIADEANTEETYGDGDTPRIVHPQMLNDSNTILAANLNANKWKLDLERIAPHLRVAVSSDGNDWRAHLDRAKKLYEETSSSFTRGKTDLNRFEKNVTSSLEKLETHENFINQQLESLILEYVAVQGQLSGVQQKQNQSGETLSRLTIEHAKLLESLEQIKQKMVDKGNEISDLTPLLQIKSAMQRLKSELREMEVQIGVLEHSLVRVSLRQAKGGLDGLKA
uniref:Intraflagellar transport protein 57 n=2 Tax=Physcomitrium patens TaxID=3218 RepID=A0A2K1JQQ6_PHYPA|nr:hypothetical protein PHYPA_016257 [Physcomitrium patens]